MKFGDMVVFTEGGEEFNALVVSSRIMDDHQGSNEEPLLDLVMVKPVMVPSLVRNKTVMVPKKVVGTIDANSMIHYRLDVAHESHEFDGDAKEKHKYSYPNGLYPGGRWKEAPVSSFTGQVVEKKKKGS